MKKLAILIGILAVLCVWSAAGATLIASGVDQNLTTSDSLPAPNQIYVQPTGGISASGPAWSATGASTASRGVGLSWSVDQVGSNYTYTYTFTEGSLGQKDILNFDLQVASNFSSSNLLSSSMTPTSTNPFSLSEPTNTTSSTIYKSISSAYRWTLPGTTDYGFTVSITTDRAPMWGDFIVESSEMASSNTIYIAAWNSNLGIPTSAAIGSVSSNGYILVPSSAVPIPGAIFLFAPGLGALAAIRRRKIK